MYPKMQSNLGKKFHSLYSSIPSYYTAPGRINLIGEHTDYNKGFVLPGAIDKSISYALGLNDDKLFRFYSMDYEEYYEVKEISKEDDHPHWAKFLLGVIAQFRKEGIEINGLDCVFGGNIPVGAGLSSSAAIECGLAYGLNKLLKTAFTKYELAQMAQHAEHEYAGVMCGIMDQYASLFGKKGNVMKLDCRSHVHEYFPLNMDNYLIALCDTQVKHALADSEYNKRRIECEEGVRILKLKHPGVKSLRDACLIMFNESEELFDPIVLKRCTYVVEENQRVEDACDALRNGKFKAFGKLMYESHHGLQHEYEVSCPELDTLVDITRSMDDVLGSRMMGGGFGGCTINLVKASGIERFKEAITKGYHDRFQKEPMIYLVKLTGGARELH